MAVMCGYSAFTYSQTSLHVTLCCLGESGAGSCTCLAPALCSRRARGQLLSDSFHREQWLGQRSEPVGVVRW